MKIKMPKFLAMTLYTLFFLFGVVIISFFSIFAYKEFELYECIPKIVSKIVYVERCGFTNSSCDLHDFSGDLTDINQCELYDCFLYADRNDPIAKEFEQKGYWEHSREVSNSFFTYLLLCKIFNLLSGIRKETGEDIAFMDVGANIGSFTMPIAVHGHFRTVSIEAYPNNVRSLKKALLSQQLQKNVMLFPYAVGNKNQKCIIKRRRPNTETDNADLHCGDADNVPVLGEPEKGEVVEMKTLATIAKKITRCGFLDDLSKIKVVKVDIEGYEPLFIEGGKEFFKQYHPIVITEENRLLYRVGYSRMMLKQLMESLGYQLTLEIKPTSDVNVVYTHSDAQREWVEKYYNSDVQ